MSICESLNSSRPHSQWLTIPDELSGFSEAMDGKVYLMIDNQPHVWRLVKYPGIGSGWLAALTIGDTAYYKDRNNRWPEYLWPTVDDKLWDVCCGTHSTRMGTRSMNTVPIHWKLHVDVELAISSRIEAVMPFLSPITLLSSC